MFKKTPFKCHIFVCVNDRKGARKSCEDGSGSKIRQILKERFQQMDLPADAVRVSQSLCLGLCNDGPNLMIYPQGRWYSGVRVEDLDFIIEDVESMLTQAASDSDPSSGS